MLIIISILPKNIMQCPSLCSSARSARSGVQFTSEPLGQCALMTYIQICCTASQNLIKNFTYFVSLFFREVKKNYRYYNNGQNVFALL